MTHHIMQVRLAAEPNPDFQPTEYRGRIRIPAALATVPNFVRASEFCTKFIENNQLGGGNWTGGQIFENGQRVAHVSYNGRIWWGVENPPKVGPEVHFYKAFPTIAIPLCLDNDKWSDESWGNDATARSQYSLDDTHTLEVWVYAFLPSEREGKQKHRYVVCVYTANGDLKSEPLQCDNASTLETIIQMVITKWPN